MSTQIRNFCIIAHIDHGKSTLADRFLELTHTIPPQKMKAQFLDQMDLERERGITIKMQPVRMLYEHPPLISADNNAEITPNSASISVNISVNSAIKNDKYTQNNRKPEILGKSQYILNLIDTPGHMDFAYEVERSLAAVEGAILLIDATKGIQAQTLANLILAQKQNLKIIPVINKIDLESGKQNQEKIKEEIKKILPDSEILTISAKLGLNIEPVLEKAIEKIPPPKIENEKTLRALVFDSKYDTYKGVIAYVRIFEGEIERGDKIELLNAGVKAEAIEVGIFKPELAPKQKLSSGEIGYIATGVKQSGLVRVGETITSEKRKVQSEKQIKINPLPGYKEPRPLVFANVFPSEEKSYPHLKDNLEKLHLNDASFTFESANHPILGKGFRCGFLGMLHLEIVFERLKREYDTKVILTSPTVVYQIIAKKDNLTLEIYSAAEMPPEEEIEAIKEPWVRLEILTPIQYSSAIFELLRTRRALFKENVNLGSDTLMLRYEAPLAEVIEDFLDKIKSLSQGYASFSYQPLGYRTVDLVKLDFAIAGEVKPSFSRLIPREKAESVGREFLLRLKNNLPAQQFPQALQAKIGTKVIAREDIRAMKKDVTAPLYGGDWSRKKKLLVKQRKGKKKLLAMASVKIPEEVYLKILRGK